MHVFDVFQRVLCTFLCRRKILKAVWRMLRMHHRVILAKTKAVTGHFSRSEILLCCAVLCCISMLCCISINNLHLLVNACYICIDSRFVAAPSVPGGWPTSAPCAWQCVSIAACSPAATSACSGTSGGCGAPTTACSWRRGR